MAQPASSRHHESFQDVRPSMAKASLEKVQTRNFQVEIGRSIERAISLAGWTKKEAAGHVGVSPQQLSNWIAGDERPHFDRLFAVDELFWPLIQMLAKLDASVETVTEIRRRA